MNYTEKQIIELIDNGTIEKLIRFKKVRQRIKEICNQNQVNLNMVLTQIAEILTGIISSSDNYSGEINDKLSKLWDYIHILEIKNERD